MGIFYGYFIWRLLEQGAYLMLQLITARKRSLGQGNIFTSMCQEFCSQGRCAIPACIAGGIPACLAAGLQGGCLLLGGGLLLGVPGGDPPGRLLLRAVRILLECILVVCGLK